MKLVGNGIAYLGCCLEVMDKLIEEGIKVDAIITDPPYGTTACKWDTVIPFDAMWERLNKLIKPNGAIVLFGSEPFSSALRMSNIKNYKYDWIWEKSRMTDFFQAKFKPMKSYENICVFYNKLPTYNPIKWKIDDRFIDRRKTFKEHIETGMFAGNKKIHKPDDGMRNPHSILSFKSENTEKTKHSTQKPVALIEYLIKTYTNEGELVLDFTAGSFTTAVACENTNRKWICIEKDEGYFNIGVERIGQNIEIYKSKLL